MPRSAHVAADREALLARLGRLQPDARAAWGRMTAPQMVAHLTESLRMADDELRIRLRPIPLRPLVRWLLLYVLPFPKGAPTAPELLARVPESWEADKARLRAMLAAVRAPQPGAKLAQHPLFGDMSARDWGVLIYKHMDHHLRQFGVE